MLVSQSVSPEKDMNPIVSFYKQYITHSLRSIVKYSFFALEKKKKKKKEKKKKTKKI